MKASAFLETASRLLQFGEIESDWRVAICSAYYGVYHTVVQKTRAKVDYSGSGDHTAARHYLSRFASSSKSKRFNRLQDARITAHYDLKKAVRAKSAEYLVRLAEELMDELNTTSLRD